MILPSWECGSGSEMISTLEGYAFFSEEYESNVAIKPIESSLSNLVHPESTSKTSTKSDCDTAEKIFSKNRTTRANGGQTSIQN
mmetsp:Transcript_9478/g.35183  ORF Transcript_9478/g.35183 Transcript_9478/m.35183 type:complete len:84 (+) Transcript_9478:3036-3287(+)